jgi:Flp pilus assembly protein TadG
MRAQRGVSTVEFALVGGFALMLLFACIEIGRLLFVWNTLDEATRRGARVAAVTPLGASAATNAVLVYNPFILGLKSSNVTVRYLDAGYLVTANPELVRFVEVAVTGYTHTLFIPFISTALTPPAFKTTLPVESLGFDPDA